MSRATLAALLLVLPVLAPAQAEAPVRSLREAYLTALENSDAVGISEQSIREAEALYRAAIGGSLPEFSARHETTWQDRRAGGAPSTQSDGMLRLSQSGLTGYRELASVRTSRSTVARRKPRSTGWPPGRQEGLLPLRVRFRAVRSAASRQSSGGALARRAATVKDSPYS